MRVKTMRAVAYLILGVLPATCLLIWAVLLLPGFWKLVAVPGTWGLVAAAFLAPHRLGWKPCLGVVVLLACGVAAEGAAAYFAALGVVETRSLDRGRFLTITPTLCALAYLGEVVAARLVDSRTTASAIEVDDPER